MTSMPPDGAVENGKMLLKVVAGGVVVGPG